MIQNSVVQMVIAAMLLSSQPTSEIAAPLRAIQKAKKVEAESPPIVNERSVLTQGEWDRLELWARAAGRWAKRRWDRLPHAARVTKPLLSLSPSLATSW